MPSMEEFVSGMVRYADNAAMKDAQTMLLMEEFVSGMVQSSGRNAVTKYEPTMPTYWEFVRDIG